jgi:hypothetical protein
METIHMSHKEIPRAGLLKAALAGKITNREGAKALQLTLRHFQRLNVRFHDDLREQNRGLSAIAPPDPLASPRAVGCSSSVRGVVKRHERMLR